MRVAADLQIGVASQLLLPANPRAVREARAFVEDCCRTASVEGDACDTAVLLTSETVTNAIIHGRCAPHVSVTVGAGIVLVEVWDDNALLPRLVEHESEALNGRGLVILDTLADCWGTTEHTTGKTVWFEVLIDPAAEPPPTRRARLRTP